MAILAQIFEPKSGHRELSFWTMEVVSNRLYENPRLKNLDPQDEKQCAFYEARVYQAVEHLVRNPRFSHEKRIAIIALTRCVDMAVEALPKAKPYSKPRQAKKPLKMSVPWWAMPRSTHPVVSKNSPRELGE
jgi:hypothetical protein